MPTRTIPLGHAVVPGAIAWSDSENALWLATESGEVITVRLLDGRTDVRGDGYGDLVGLLPARDGIEVFVLERTGAAWSGLRESAGRADVASVCALPPELVALRPHPDGGALVLESGPTARLLRAQWADGSVTDVATNLASPTHLAVDPGTRRAYVAEQPESGARVVGVDLDTGVVEVLAPLEATAMVADPGSSGVIVAHGPTGALDLVTAAGVTVGPALGAPARALARWGSLLLAVTDSEVIAIEWDLDEGTLPVHVPLGPAFVGGWLRAEFDPVPLGLAPEDVTLVVDEGSLAGSVSVAYEPPGANGRRLRILAGPVPGEYHVSARRVTNGLVLGRARFRVTRHWPDREVGPPVAYTGPTQYFRMWGGGPDGPLNLGNHRAPAEWRVGLVFVSTDDRRLPADLTALSQTWIDRLTGPGLSARSYYEEVSYRNTAGGAGAPPGTTIVHTAPVMRLELALGWGDYFEQPKNKGNWYGWDPQEAFKQGVAGALCDQLDATGQGGWLQNVDTVLFVVQTASEGWSVVGTKLALAKYVWPQVSRKICFYRRTVQPDGVTTTAFREMPILFMPTHTPANMPASEKMQATNHTHILCHELGHTLGCDDLYYKQESHSAEIEAREIGNLDLMGNDADLPHFTIPNRMRLGWVGPNAIERIDFNLSTAPRDIVLQAAETLTRDGAPSGRKGVVEICVGEALSYYFEYRRPQPGQQGDQHLPVVAPPNGELVLGTDVAILSNDFFGPVAGGDEPVRRPRIMRLPVDADGEGPILDAVGEDYAETDVTNKDAAHDFTLRFDGLILGDANAVRVHVDYVAARRADLRIRPAPGAGNWKSPDINLEGPKGANAVAKGLAHTIVVRVRNAGTEDAKNVHLRVSWLPFTTSPGPWNTLTDPPRQDIAKNSTVEFRLPWTPPANAQVGDKVANHFCVRAEVDRYVDPTDDTHSEIVIANNWAQSNFDSTEVAHGSPSERRSGAVTVTNRYESTATYLTAVDQDSPLLRVYVGAAWHRLEPQQSAVVDVDYESLAGDPAGGAQFQLDFERASRQPPPTLSLTSLVLLPDPLRWTAPQTVWGATLSIRVGRRTVIELEGLFERIVRGTVAYVDEGNRFPLSYGTVNLMLFTVDRPDVQFVVPGTVDNTGRFDIVVPREIYDANRARIPVRGEAFYLAEWPWAPSRSGEKQLNPW